MKPWLVLFTSGCDGASVLFSSAEFFCSLFWAAWLVPFSIYGVAVMSKKSLVPHFLAGLLLDPKVSRIPSGPTANKVFPLVLLWSCGSRIPLSRSILFLLVNQRSSQRSHRQFVHPVFGP
jgi:hypothetical protein